ncbi:MAG: DUF1963 domain-containing protein [Ruminococcus sp.]|nr:DUF1963 domain-containing protein [Ruminococcus sp.]MDE7098103.1 DUF1963 domain-containing protein [Ruminococcus sp.]
MSKELTLFEQLERDGYTEEAETLKKYYKNAVILKYCLAEGEIPIGASKTGCPDLPPEIELPDMSLVIQLNMCEIAESGADIENLLPKTGMLYIFWNPEPLEDFEDPDYDIIYWDGDMSTLRRCGNSDERECTIGFEAHEEYDEYGVAYEDLRDLVSDYGYDPGKLAYTRDKLFGYVSGGNVPEVKEDDILLLQYGFDEGCIWNVYWITDKESIKNHSFGSGFYYDMD